MEACSGENDSSTPFQITRQKSGLCFTPGGNAIAFDLP
jgi:hypothetical protein